jgi:hypothetical protein
MSRTLPVLGAFELAGLGLSYLIADFVLICSCKHWTTPTTTTPTILSCKKRLNDS